MWLCMYIPPNLPTSSAPAEILKLGDLIIGKPKRKKEDLVKDPVCLHLKIVFKTYSLIIVSIIVYPIPPIPFQTRYHLETSEYRVIRSVSVGKIINQVMMSSSNESESTDVKPIAIVGSSFVWHINSGCFKGKKTGEYALSRTFTRCNRRWQLRLESQGTNLPPLLSLEIVSLPIRWSFRVYISYSTLRFKSDCTPYETEHDFLNNIAPGEKKKSCVLGPVQGEFDFIQCKFDLRYLLPENKRKKSSVSSSQLAAKRPRKDSSSSDSSSSSATSYNSFERRIKSATSRPTGRPSCKLVNRSLEKNSSDDSESTDNEEEESSPPVTSSDDCESDENSDLECDTSQSKLLKDSIKSDYTVRAQSPILSGSHLSISKLDASASVSSGVSSMKRKSLTKNSSSPKISRKVTSPPGAKPCIDIKMINEFAGKTSNMSYDEPNERSTKMAKLSVKTEKPRENNTKDNVLNSSSLSSRSALVKPELKTETKAHIKPKIKPPDTRLALDLEGLMNDEKFSDVVVRTQTFRKFYAHKAILSARSGEFFEMIQQNEKEGKREVVVLDIEDNVLEELLRFIYTGTVSNIDTNTLELFKASDRFKVQGLRDMCVRRLEHHLNIDNASNILIISNKNNYLTLKNQALEYINQNAANVINTKGFRKMIQSDPVLVSELYCMLVEGMLFYKKLISYRQLELLSFSSHINSHFFPCCHYM
ncbi:hypothetical protein QAD02_022274 [Eretmocerus hayati]|uniref:Uncharacterized protein n=1 Tax=Eretmocerus hayati TaxID=131215 RepID=A0ACC2PSU0_9HYME|nr:hypothetical protein QAD02_022274 [Eretmocerus hayati]